MRQVPGAVAARAAAARAAARAAAARAVAPLGPVARVAAAAARAGGLQRRGTGSRLASARVAATVAVRHVHVDVTGSEMSGGSGMSTSDQLAARGGGGTMGVGATRDGTGKRMVGGE